MATIPVGSFGQSIARGPIQTDFPRGNPAADAAQRTTEIAGAVVSDMAAEELKRQEAKKRAEAALSLAKTSNAMHDAHDEVARGVQDGTIQLDKAPGELTKRVTKLRDEAVGGYADPAQRDAMHAHLLNTEGTLQRNLNGAVLKRSQVNAAGSIDDFGEQMQRYAMREGPAKAVSTYSNFVRNTAPSAGLDERAQAKLIQGFTEKAHTDFYTNAGVAALAQGNDGALRQLREQIAGPSGEFMDPQRKATLSHTLFGWEQSILAKRDRDANKVAEDGRKRHNEAVDMFNKAADLSMAGAYLSPEFIAKLTETAAGTEMAPRVFNLISSQRVVAGFASLPADKRTERIERLRNERATPTVGVDPLDEKLLQMMVTTDGKLREQAEDNPWAAAQSAGVITDAPVLNLADPATAVQAIQSRMAQISTVENWTGKRASPLQPKEVEQLSKFVRQIPVDQAATMLSSIGAALGNSERVAALGKQLHDKDGTLGLAMMYATASTSEGRRVAELVLRGEQAIKDNRVMVDKAAETGWASTFAKAIRGAYSNPETENQLIDAAYKIAAARYVEGKGTDLDQAIKLATGGIIERNGKRIPLPYGMSERDFEKKLATIDAASLAPQAPDGQVFIGRTPMSLEQFTETLPKATLVHAGQGLYNVRAGTGVVTNAQGKRITLRVSP